MNKEEQYAALQCEVVKLFGYIQKVKEELAAIKHPKANIDHFATVADKLTAIVETTEAATQEIMDASEVILDAMSELRKGPEPEGSKDQIDRLGDAVNRIFEACSFHDLTGQRITKIIKTMNIIEGSLNSLVVIVGEQGLAALPINVKSADEYRDGALLHGPQRNGQGVSQADIDKLFD